MLAALLNAPRAEGAEPLSDAELHDELKAFLVAGHTTTASALGWLWYVLWEHPEARIGSSKSVALSSPAASPALTISPGLATRAE